MVKFVHLIFPGINISGKQPLTKKNLKMIIKRSKIGKSAEKLLLCGAVITCSLPALALEKPLIFPIPQEMKVTQETFLVDESVSILVPENAVEPDINLAKALVRELSDKYSVAVRIKAVTEIPATGKNVIMGTLNNPLVRKYCSENKLELTGKKPGPEGYILNVRQQSGGGGRMR